MKYSGLFSVFWPILMILLFEWSQLVLLFPSPRETLNFFGDSSECPRYNWYHCHFQVLQFFQFSSKGQVLIFLFAFFQFYLELRRNSKVHYSAYSLSAFFLINYRKVWLAGRDQMICLYRKILDNFLCLIFQNGFWVVNILLFVWSNLILLPNSQCITFPHQFCLILHFFFENFYHLHFLVNFYCRDNNFLVSPGLFWVF